MHMNGMLVGAVFGAVFVVVNAGEPLDPAVVTILRIAAIAGAASVLAMWLLAVRQARTGAAPPQPRRTLLTKGYWWAVIAEVILLFGGIRVLGAVGVPTEVNVAWVALVVGLHFVPIAISWKEPRLYLPTVVLSLLGVAGFVMAALGALAWVPVVSGVLPGVFMLAATVGVSVRGFGPTAVTSG
ncbi:hypothetical protein [Nonomuraea soli]|uniref:Uncharacterized protein n=1 Tax=Nonomuraea soli TaxID=1032476 RepID=A0A7W0CIX7_9ACTN|nr:hypothetical protein [Nonomuraea soli]MBA2892006.1 hypothetical protein [Nonomuraea soli]